MEVSGSVSTWVNVGVMICSALAGAATLFTDLVGQGPAQKIVAGISIAGLVLGAINTALHQAGGIGVAK